MNIFVAKLDYNVQNEDLQELFVEYGQVASAFVVYDRALGRSKGFGFVEMPNEDEAMEAIESLNESTFAGRRIVVKKAEPRR